LAVLTILNNQENQENYENHNKHDISLRALRVPCRLLSVQWQCK
jgi:hypothetical protein